MSIKILFPITLLVFLSLTLSAQLLIGKASSEINFREGPGTNYKVMHTINSSNLLVVLPREIQNGFIEAFDVETSSRGYIYESLIEITDTLFFQKQQFLEKQGGNSQGDIEIALINKTNHTLFVWINKKSFDVAPYEKKTVIIEEEELIYFSSAPGLFPVFGKETLSKGESYKWNFTL